MFKLLHQRIGIWLWGLQNFIGFRWHHEGRTLRSRLGVIIRNPRELSVLLFPSFFLFVFDPPPLSHTHTPLIHSTLFLRSNYSIWSNYGAASNQGINRKDTVDNKRESLQCPLPSGMLVMFTNSLPRKKKHHLIILTMYRILITVYFKH